MWKIFKKKKPKKDGWYQCTVEVKNFQRYTMNLYWYNEEQIFQDNIRENVCQTYEVIGCNGNRLFDIGQDRTSDVIAWDKIKKPYMKGFIYERL